MKDADVVPQTTTVTAIPDANTVELPAEITTELVGFVVRGRRLSERLQIDDLDSLLMPDERRLLPLLRVLRTFRVNIEEEAGVLRFTPEGVGSVELDLTKRQVQIRGQTRPIEFRQAVSEITLKADVFVSAEDLSDILDMELVWNIELYEYRVQLDRKLSIWKLPTSKSLFSVATEYVEADLPEALPRAEGSKAPLQMLQFDWRPGYSLRRRASDDSATHMISVGAPRETIWGNVLDGQYRVQISHPNRSWSNNEGWRWSNDDPYLAEVDWFEWVHRLSTAEVTVGDSSFGLSDLVYPTFHATGVRINGLTGWSPDELRSDQSRLGLRRYFGRPHVFEGPAPIDATVELLLNGRTIDVQNVLPDASAAPGMGTYRFEQIELPSGILNEITIVIRETSGNEIRVEKSIAGTPQLLPKGHTAYLGLAGTKRERTWADKQSFDVGDFYGYISGGRILYGLTDRVTIGTTLAYEQDHYGRYLENDAWFSDRVYPESSSHAGAMVSYLPRDNVILSGDLAGSSGDGLSNYNDLAARARAEYLPTRKLSLDLDLLTLEPDYFDGTNLTVRDRRGADTGFSWKPYKRWTFDGGIGQVHDNLDGRLAETTFVDYQSLGLSTTALPRTSLAARFYHLDVSTEDDPMLLTELGLRFALARDLSLFGQVTVGDELSVSDDDRFLTGLRFRHAPRLLRPSQYWTLRKALSPDSTVSLVYNDQELDSSLSLVHDRRLQIKQHPLQFRTEFIKELLDDPSGEEYGFRLRSEYLLDSVGNNYLGLMSEYRHGDYSVLLYLNIKQIYSRHNMRLININESRIRTAYGAIHGKVFLDYNGDHLLDSDEPGVPGVKVSLGRHLGAVTDERGYYILSAPANESEARVYLDSMTVPAIYSVTHGTQLARLHRDSLTEVNLSVVPLISLIGRVVLATPVVPEPNRVDPNTAAAGTTELDTVDVNDIWVDVSDIAADANDVWVDVNDVVADSNDVPADSNDVPVETRPLRSVRVVLYDAQSGLLVAESVTGSDGSYYLGDVKPGRYKLSVDPNTVRLGYAVSEPERIITVEPTREEFAEIEQRDFVATVQEEAPPESASPEPPPASAAPAAGTPSPQAASPEATAPEATPAPEAPPTKDGPQEQKDPNAPPGGAS